MTYYVIGNGFDLHYQLPTSYFHFKQFLYQNGYKEIAEKVDWLFQEKSDYSPFEIEKWSDFENMLTAFNNLNYDDLYYEAMENAETDDDRADFFDSPSWNVNYYNEYISVLKNQFQRWIESIDTDITKDPYFMPEYDDYILSFNYTKTIEDNFSIEKDRILHIHGISGDELIVGHNEYQEPDLYPVVWNEDSDYRETKTEEAVNDVLKQTSTLYFKNSESILYDNQPFFEVIDFCDTVIIMGLSCGNQDQIYLYEIFKHTDNVVFYYHDQKTLNRFLDIVPPNINLTYRKW